MFTGIVEEQGKINGIARGAKSIRLTIGCEKVLEGTRKGDSIAVNGICLTVTDLGKGFFEADVMPETMSRTGLSGLSSGDGVNLERALKLSDRLGGHIVSGHIDGTGILTGLKDDDNAAWLTISAEDEILKYIVLKGSVALDGTSLTVAYVDDKSFKVSLIPLTKSETILGRRKTGDVINIECDVLGKYVEKLLGLSKKQPEKKADISMEFLRENGFT